ncbi:MAG: hypothetical protein NZ928_04680 [Endomicrobia bacterium]|nr:hypothetical protein [Endomicrobiia bacterium]MDW8055669.1 hypothetical protein [Elusimicrobiota bacterium]
MKTIKCPICGTENRTTLKYCRVCFSRLISTSHGLPLKTNFYPKVIKHRSVLGIFFVLILLLLLWILLNR